MKKIVSPFSDKLLDVKIREEQMSFRKDTFSVLYHYYEDMGERFTTDELDEINLKQVYNQYREKYNLPFAEEIKNIREKYQLSASKMADVLGFGANIYRQYEAGEVPSQSNARLIQLADDPGEFRKLVLLSGALEEKEQEKVLKRVDQLIEKQSRLTFDDLIACYVLGAKSKLTRYNGYKKPDIEKTFSVIQFLVAKLNPTKTALNKLLFYVDFMHFSKHSVSFLGLEYRAIEYGTVPSRYESLLEYGAEAGFITRERFTLDNGGYKETYNLGNHVISATFTEEEADTLKQVTERFKTYTAAQIVGVNHKEEAWLSNIQNKSMVDYKFAYKLLTDNVS
ncbi:type II toxin-antitoxin system antitoxin SocA domain-containing protein [Leadbetterella sp. DM7]|uniref:type II toxin-antitoxin system antitoxin SocA domain-containing protein n=1 Tax=Leadbetterella sp. DM7 TaxID=3235085 RepID=UPI00349E51B1